MARWARGDERPASKRLHALTDPDAPEEYRINGVVSNMPEFARAFDCKPGQSMVRATPAAGGERGGAGFNLPMPACGRRFLGAPCRSDTLDRRSC
jgi:hypothetical protein